MPSKTRSGLGGGAEDVEDLGLQAVQPVVDHDETLSAEVGELQGVAAAVVGVAAAVDQVDEVVMLFDQAVSARESRAKSKTDETLIERAKAGEARQLLLDVTAPRT